MFTIKAPLNAVHFDSDDDDEDPYNYLFLSLQNEHYFIHCAPDFTSEVDIHASAPEGSAYHSENISIIAAITGIPPIVGVDHFDTSGQFLTRVGGITPEIQLSSGELSVQKAVLPIIGETLFSCEYTDASGKISPLVIVKLLSEDPQALHNGNIVVYTVVDSLFQMVDPERYSLDITNPTILVASYPGSLIQVTSREVRLIIDNQQPELWEAETLPNIIDAKMSGPHLILTLDNGALVYFNIARYVYTTLGTPVIHEPSVAAVTEQLDIVSSFRARTCHLATVNQLNLLEIMNVSETLFSPMFSMHLGELKCTSLAWLDAYRLIVAYEDMSLSVFMIDNALTVKQGATKHLHLEPSHFRIFTDPATLSLFVSTEDRLMQGTVEEDEISLQWLALPRLDCVLPCSREFIGLPRIGISPSGLVFFEVDQSKWQTSSLKTRYTPVSSFVIEKKPSYPDFSYQLFGILERENNCMNWSQTKGLIGENVETFLSCFGKVYADEVCSCLRIVKSRVNDELELQLSRATVFSAPKGSVITAACEFKHKSIDNTMIAIATYSEGKSNVYIYQLAIKIGTATTTDEEGESQEYIDLIACDQHYVTGIETEGMINTMTVINGHLCTFGNGFTSYALLQRGEQFNLVSVASQDLSLNVYSAQLYKSPSGNLQDNYLLLNSDRGALRVIFNKNQQTSATQPLILQASDIYNRHQTSLLPLSDTQVALTSLHGNFVILDLSEIDAHLMRTNRLRNHAKLMTSASTWLPDLPVSVCLHRLIPGQERSVVIHGQSGAVYIIDALTEEDYHVLQLLEDVLSREKSLTDLYAMGGSISKFMSRAIPRKSVLALDFIKLWTSLDETTRENYRLLLPVEYTANELKSIVRRCCVK